MVQNQNINDFNSLGGARGFGVSPGATSVEDGNLSLKELNEFLGKDFKDKDTALKSLKDTFAYVGKAGQLEPKVKELEEKLQSKDSASSDIKMLKDELFYSNNPQYKPYRETITAMGDNPAEVVDKDAFKKIFSDLSEYEKTKNQKSVLVSNPRIGQAKTKVTEARELENKGQHATAKATAVSAVLEAYDLE